MKARNTEHPILFSTPMVQAILEERKTMTRRIVTKVNFFNNPSIEFAGLTDGDSFAHFKGKNDSESCAGSICPFGKPGDKLWVKEMYYAYGYWEQKGKTKTGKNKYSFVDCTGIDFVYKYQENKPQRLQTGKTYKMGWYKRSSMFMPRKASRLLLEITNIRVECLHNISEADAMSEGAEALTNMHSSVKFSSREPNYRTGFASIWMKINGEESWKSNPWVWVIEFKRINNQ